MDKISQRGAVEPLPEQGEGCTRRFAPDALNDQLGTDFPAARQLWEALQEKPGQPAEPPGETS